jgi:hypothetical protein
MSEMQVLQEHAPAAPLARAPKRLAIRHLAISLHGGLSYACIFGLAPLAMRLM